MLVPEQAPGPTSTPLVTIVTPSLNRSSMLEATVRSVRAQSYPSVEHIVVDGGSTDDTLAILDRHAGTYALRWVSEVDGGMYDAINKGLRQAGGEIQAYLNSDDVYFPWTVDVVVDAFARHPEVDIVYGDVMDVEEPSGRLKLAWNLPFDLGYLRRFGYMWQPGVFWRSGVFEAAGGFDETIRYGADLDFWLRLGASGRRFMKVNEFLAVVRQHPGTLSQVHRPRIIEEVAEIRASHGPGDGGRGAPPARQSDRTRRGRWSRIYWAALFLQSLVPGPLRRGPWSRFLGEGQTTFSYMAVVVKALPKRRFRRLRRRFGGPILRTSRNWLEPPG
jgi:hypothetical protein